MKISQLQKISTPRRDIEIPLAVEGENRNITLGQILDEVPRTLVHFSSVESATAGTVIANTSGPSLLGSVIFDTDTNRFYLSTKSCNLAEGTLTTTYYTSWNGSGAFFDAEGHVRKDCLFLSSSGRLYFFDGDTLKTAGGSRVVVISEDEYALLPSYDPDTFYYTYED